MAGFTRPKCLMPGAYISANVACSWLSALSPTRTETACVGSTAAVSLPMLYSGHMDTACLFSTSATCSQSLHSTSALVPPWRCGAVLPWPDASVAVGRVSSLACRVDSGTCCQQRKQGCPAGWPARVVGRLHVSNDVASGVASEAWWQRRRGRQQRGPVQAHVQYT